jgi:crotonobetainyl-CoA:carnitine CoA-transferase CaiB-like acyl-CoA transferase
MILSDFGADVIRVDKVGSFITKSTISCHIFATFLAAFVLNTLKNHSIKIF